MNFSSIDALFSSIAPSYDFMNDLMSLGLHHVWKSVFVEALPLHSWQEEPLVYVDMACGTGDIGGLVMERAEGIHRPLRPIFIDPNEDLMALAQGKYRDPRIEWRQESAEAVSLPSDSVHLYTISFGLRNVESRAKALQRAWDILIPGGYFYCLEFSHPENPLVQEAFYAYLKLLPSLGRGAIGQGAPYAYLAQSIRDFPAPKRLMGEMEEAGFQHVKHRPLSQGIVGITWGIKGWA